MTGTGCLPHSLLSTSLSIQSSPLIHPFHPFPHSPLPIAHSPQSPTCIPSPVPSPHPFPHSPLPASLSSSVPSLHLFHHSPFRASLSPQSPPAPPPSPHSTLPPSLFITVPSPHPPPFTTPTSTPIISIIFAKRNEHTAICTELNALYKRRLT